MARRNTAQIQFDALSIEGAILPAEWLGKVAALEAAAQTPGDYGIPKGLQLRDEIGRYWRIAQAVWTEFTAAREGSDPVGASKRLTRDLLMQVFGLTDLAPAGERDVSGRSFPVAFEALGGRVPVVVGPPTESLDQNVQRHGDGARRRSAWGVLQEYLNAADGALWGITTNGLCLRLGRDNASLTRPAWMEADLERIFGEERFADFSVLWLLLHASRFGRSDQPVQEAPLERWREAGREEGSRARDALRVGVEDALRTLGQGFVAHPSNVELRAALASGELSPGDYFNELLRLVYRMIFLLTVEERGILHMPGADADAVSLYATGYGLRRLRERSVRHSAHDRHTDLWASLRPVFSGLGSAKGEPALGLTGLGGLFAEDQCPHLDGATLENRALLTAVFRLAWLREGNALARVNWKDMGVEEFGSVYESLLELVPVVSDGGRRFGFAGEGESAGNARKLTGSYYTPDALVQQLLETALEPVVSERLAQHPEPRAAEQALLSLAVVDPACGSGHFLLAAARRLAGHLARVRSGGTPGAAEYRHALRDVATHCIHGVDRNPMALELARMALWLEAYTPDRALGFLDHHLVCGDALLGLLDLNTVKDGIPDDAFKALTGDNKDVAKVLAKLNRAGRKAIEAQRKKGQLSLALGTDLLAAAYKALDALGDDGIEGVTAKRERYDALRVEAQQSVAALAADVFVGAFLMPKRLAEGERALTEQQASGRFPTTSTLSMALEGSLAPTHPAALAARAACADARVLHWPLAFPQVFARGGFDVVLGNPPWELAQLNEEEFFAARSVEIAAKLGAARKSAISDLPQTNPSLWNAYERQKALYESFGQFVRSCGRYPRTAFGRLNSYPAFAETAESIAGPHGHVGLVLPLGIATDDSTKRFFSSIVEEGRLLSLFGFDNSVYFSSVGLFGKQFVLLTLGEVHSSPEPTISVGLSEVHDLADARRRFALSAADLDLLNPNTRNVPVFRASEDARLAKAIYRAVPILIQEAASAGAANPWKVSFAQGLFNLTSDSGNFSVSANVDSVPVYEAKMMHQYDHRWATFERTGSGKDDVGARDLSDEEKRNSSLEPAPRYWVDRALVQAALAERAHARKWLIGWRDVTKAANERTLIASVLPAVGIGNSIPLLFRSDDTETDPRLWAALLANFNSLVLDFVARLKIGGTHMNYFILKQLPVIPPWAYDSTALHFIASRVCELTFTSLSMKAWADDLGFGGQPAEWNPERRMVLRAELDAWYARAYGLSRDELRYVLDPGDAMGDDYPSETFRVLKNNEVRTFGEFRTARLVLAAWDRLFGA